MHENSAGTEYLCHPLLDELLVWRQSRRCCFHKRHSAEADRRFKNIDDDHHPLEQVDSTTSDQSNDSDHVSLLPNKMYGRTPEGTVFTVPATHDMVSQLLDPREPKNITDVAVILILAFHIFLAYSLPPGFKRPIFALIFMFWRASYNIGIGYLLNVQSKHRRIVTWARRWRLFEAPSSGNQPRPWLYNLLKREFETKIPEDYEFDKAPLEYNTWLLFRRVVDLILMCDFVSYCLFAIVCSSPPAGESLGIYLTRWGLGIGLVGFNLWVKLDAHRVVKDYAWYWGDFFYLIDQELTFDGVFEMAPHPMYSIGYAGYYGISMMAASYDVLFISIVAHVAQFVFLVLVENPHIEKTYNPRSPKEDLVHQVRGTAESLSQVHNLVGLKNLDLFRATDYTVILLCGYVGILTLVTPSTPLYQFLFVLHAAVWRVWFTAGLGAILHLQSRNKLWTRHFVKYGETPVEAWNQWKALYHINVHTPEDWNYGWVPLKHVLGGGLVALQVWTATSIHESLGEFGWFFGDFFFDSRGKLTYTSIYRFLNNPERILGSAGIWGAALITWSRAIFIMALMNQILTWGFISFVEKPHMQKIYGRNVRNEAGLTKFIKKSLPPLPRHGAPQVRQRSQDHCARYLGPVQLPARLTITRLAPDLAGFDPKYYSLEVDGTPSGAGALDERATGKESVAARFRQDGAKTLSFEYGAPLRVKWRAPAHHSKKDWIGLYMVADNHSREVTDIASLGRWTPTNEGVYDEETANNKSITVSQRRVEKTDPSAPDLVEGEVTFSGDRLWWTQGVFEFRLHHDGRHNVMAISQPFEVRIGKFVEDDVEVDASSGAYERAAEEALLPVVRNCLDRDPDIAPSAAEEPFGSHVERDSKYAKRVVYAIHQMFGVEFAAAVVPADGNVKKLAWRICNAKQVLAPYSMSASRGTTTPI
ncbi:unnamed protein product [Parascedosporium putredinis]|uniref:Phosphatidylethanolamine N-methyltransferase n=1 Tax=Parascedosporium putredinis TaxID=1442378 RepID=A0A9P1MD11_9PEZI|nr:unnamed protein product [Parascedosporium putredinis]CAI7998765.1 unnamed protein product [Parascedosporium putredinis]